MRSIVIPRAWRRRIHLPMLLAATLVGAVPTAARAQLQQRIVRSVNFTGNHAIEDEVLAAAIATTESSWFARSPLVRWMGLGEKRYFSESEFVSDVFRLLVVYRRSGYPDVKVDTTVKRSPEAISVTFHITEGEPVRLKQLAITGLDSVENAFRIRQDLPIRTGDVASGYLLYQAADTIALRLRNRGYPTAFVDVILDKQDPRDSARLEVHTGQYSVFGSIVVHDSLEPVDTAHAAALLVARPGEEYQLNKILESQRTLYTSDLYRYANVEIDTARYNVDDSVVPLSVTVIPGLGHRAKASVGYGTDDCLRMGLGWTARNFPSSGLVFDVTGQVSKIGVGDPLSFGLDRNICATLRGDSIGSRKLNYGLNASLRRNAFLSPNNAAVLSLFATRHSEFKVYLRQEVGGSFSVTRTTAAGVPITIAYRIASGTTSANPASFCAFFLTCQAADIAALRERRWQGTLSASVLRQHLNNPIDPLRGSVLSASAVWSSKYLGSSNTQQFLRLVGDASAYVPIRRRTVLAGHVRGGVIFAPRLDLGDSTRGSFVPPDQRFYAGGANDVRGYDQNEMGPLAYVIPADSINPDGTVPTSATRVAPTGGTRVVIANLELRIPTPLFGGRLGVAAFVDGGALWRKGEPASVRITPGAGLRYSSPIGPIRFDIGYNSYPLQAGPLFAINSDGSLTELRSSFVKDRGNRWTLHFSIGQAF